MQWRAGSAPGRGVRLHVRRVVDPPAPPVLLLHGLGVDGSVWQAFARRLLPYLAALAPDLRGHGLSEAPSSGYTPTDYAGDLVELLTTAHPAGPEPSAAVGGTSVDALDGQELGVPIVGHSLGALVALRLAVVRPELVRWLVLLDPPLDPELPNPEVASVARLRHAPLGQLEAYLLDRNPGGGQLLAQALARLFRHASDAAFGAFLQPDPVSGHAPTRFAAEAIASASCVQQRCLVIQADPERGGLLGDGAARAFVDGLPRGCLLKISGATHAVHASHPADVARAIVGVSR